MAATSATTAKVLLWLLVGALGISGVVLLTLCLFYYTRDPHERLHLRLDRETDLAARHAERRRLAHVETHVRRTHLLSDILDKNRHHLRGRGPAPVDGTASYRFVNSSRRPPASR